MAYHVFFRAGRAPALVISVPRAQWEAVTIHEPGASDAIAAYLWASIPEGVRWQQGGASIGYRGCCKIDKLAERVDLHFPIHRDKLRHTLLSMSFILQDLEALTEKDFAIEMTCGEEVHLLFGRVSQKFVRGLTKVSKSDLELVAGQMQKAWRSSAPKSLQHKTRDCKAKITEDGRFELDCFGDACDVSMYPGEGLKFRSHNIHSPHEQATLLAGLAALRETVHMRW